MRGAPQVGFSATIRKIRSRTSFEILFLPVTRRALEIARQYRANPDLCHRTTVSGLTTIRACFHPHQNLRANTQKILSSIVSLGLRRLRFSVTSCWRRTRFSRSKLRRPRKRQRIVPSSSPKVSIIRDCYRSLLVERNAVSCLKSQADGILANDRFSSGSTLTRAEPFFFAEAPNAPVS